MILALETSTEVCSVSLRLSDGSIDERRIAERGSHSEKLFVFIRELFEEHSCGVDDLDAVLMSGGPGSYTGLRISASAVKGLLFQREVPLWSANTLASFAAGLMGKSNDQRIHGVIDARRKHLYHQLFEVESGRLKPLNEVMIRPLDDFENWVESGDALIGTGIERLPGEVQDRATCFGIDHISARSLMVLYEMHQNNKLDEGEEPLFRQVDVAEFEPRYYTNRQVKG